MQLHMGLGQRCFSYKSLFKLLQLLRIRACCTDKYLSTLRKYGGTLELFGRWLLMLLLKLERLSAVRMSLSSEFHSDTEEGIHDFRDISVRVVGVTRLLLFLSK